jgi:hypothetical protein
LGENTVKGARGIKVNTRIKDEIEKIFSICPKLLINAELYSLVLTPRLKKGYIETLGANVPAFINTLTSMF